MSKIKNCLPIVLSIPFSFHTAYAATEIEEVIITAEKRETNLQDTALTITALSGDNLVASGVTDSMDLQLHTPGLVMSSNGGWGLPYLRGVGTDIIGPGVDSGVAIYVDGVYQARNAGKVQQLLDVERVEVLKGPQGILYGRNAIGGAINIISKAPTEEFQASAGLELGNYGQRTIRGAVSGPLVDGKVLGRFSFLDSDEDGSTKDLLNGKKYQFSDTSSLRGALAIQLTDSLNAQINASYSESNAAYAYTPMNPDTNPLFTVFGATNTGDPRKVLNDNPNKQKTEEWGVNAKLTWDLENYTLSSITAFNNNRHRLTCDLDGTEIPIISCGSASFDDEPFDEESDFFSQEMVLTSQNSDKFEWTGLLYYMHEDASLFGRNDLPLFGLITRTFADVTAEAYAVAVQGTYFINSKLSVMGGVRLSHETKSIKNSKTDINDALIGAADDDDSWTVATPKVVIQYSPSNDLMVYASATEGFKSGGYNAFEIQGSFDEELLWSYELGMKSTWLDNRLRLNLTGFHYDYKDLQINQWQTVPSGILGIVDNAGSASTNGAEVELLTTLTENFKVEMGIAYLDAEFDEFVSIDPDRPEEGSLDRAGNVLPRSPKTTVNLAAEYAIPLPSGQLSLRGEYFWRDKIYITQFEDERASVDPISIVNAVISYENTEGDWDVALFGKNLSDEEYPQHIITIQSLLGQVGLYAPPKTYGIRFNYNF